MKAVRPVIASNGVSHLKMSSVGSHSTSGREMKETFYGVMEYKIHFITFFSLCCREI
jgi:hypothetical protein